MAENKTEFFHIRVTPELKAAVEEAAANDGRTVSNYIEWLIKQALKQ